MVTTCHVVIFLIYMNRKQLFSKISASPKLPTPSRVALEVMRLCHSDSASLSEIAKIIQTDPALSAELLKYANSASLSTGIQVTSIQKASVKLGMRAIVNLALGFSLLSHNRDGRCLGFDYGNFWSTSLARAIAAKTICDFLKEFDPEEMFVCGLLAHIGSLTFASVYTDEYSNILIMQPNTEQLIQHEISHFGFSCAELTTELFLEWGIPKHFAAAAGCHELDCVSEFAQDPVISRMALIIQLANRIAELCQTIYPDPQRLSVIEEKSEQLGIEPKNNATLFDTIVTCWQEWGELFKIPTQSCPLYHEIKELEQNRNTTTGEKDPLDVLIVDDDPLTVLNLEKLISTSGHRVITANDGEEALQLAVEKQPQLIITDWRMPKLSGIELCRIIRSTPATQHMYIIMVTALENEDEIVQAFEAGADDYVVKPFTPRVLDARVRSGERIIRYQKMLQRDREVIQGYTAKLSSANQELQTMAMTDALTGLPNRRYAMARLKEAIVEAKRHNEPLSCIMLDLDKFKSINDTYGHHAGDQVLKDVADIFKNAARTYDTICRMGGEEFLIISSRNDAQSTGIFAERLRQDIEAHSSMIDGHSIQVTASFGVAQWNGSCKHGDRLIQEADRAMYKAKTAGKNQVEVV